MGKPSDYGPILNGVMWLQVGVSSVFIMLRIYTRFYIIRSLGWDDYMMVINLAVFIAFIATTSIGVSYGVGKTTEDIARLGLDNSKAIFWEAVGQGICIMGIAVSKAAIALFLLRIVVRKWHIALLWSVMISTAIFSTITTALLFLQCKPVSYLWNPTIPGGHCPINFTDVGLSMGAWSAAMDFILAILPWPVVMGLNMKRKEKVTIACGLSLGFFAGCCSVVRTVELRTLASKANYVYDTAPMLLWSSSEICLTIICACIPVLRPLYVRIAYGSRGDSSGASGGRSHPLKDYSHSKKGSFGKTHGLRGSAKSRVYIGQGESALRTTVKMGSDNASEETILRECHKDNIPERARDDEMGVALPACSRKNDIRVTTTVEVEENLGEKFIV
ncbi:uncharacterized protein M421DRAFT_377119 [Didymella exigua CBS 183.55]|uniref:Rhodopsin domain-containing protein n=1 Tax=Didymella exigua CBS 183.55 TaxID=1150837 RepID=A0A6A5RQ63_9PLEO|nr:uncharacterized protein M421DRAFT_377119 [Didymella exigua CBS 183.55]KAF1930581.1 hypothetical protein M421DRAFT_377119 [Didymella exigua CBS 183.55]